MDPTFANLFSLDGKVAVVTGASSGIGVALARGLARAGADVVVTARRQEMIDETAAMCRSFGGRASAWTADITDEAQFEGLFTKTVEEYGRLDILVNNAGFTDRTALRHDQNSMRKFRAIVELDLLATMNGCRLAARQMLAQDPAGGVIINISSILGKSASEFRASAYHAAKAGVDGLSRILAYEYAREGIRVNSIAPSYFEGTEMMDQVFDAAPQTKVHTIERTPMGRLGRPEDLEGAIAFLCSDAGRFITGHTLYVDGGWSIGGGFHQKPALWESELGRQDPNWGRR
ncbi:MAG: SDR family NAD(P)-dependent oxidoreductase [Dehalococcoidia bacterium]